MVKIRWLMWCVGRCMLLFLMMFISLVRVVGWLLELLRVVVRDGIRWLKG